MKKKTVSIILFIVFVTSLYVFQITVVGPGVESIATSDFFMENTEDEVRLDGIINEKTNFALFHCRKYLTENYELSDSDIIAERDYKAWGLGGYTYVIKSYVDVVTSEQGPMEKKFVCTISYEGGDELDYANWTISGFNYE